MREPINTSIVLDKRYPKQDGTFPLRLRVTFMRKQKYYGLKGYAISEKDYAQLHEKKVKQEFKGLKAELTDFENQVNNLILTINPFSFSQFEKELYEEFQLGKNPEATVSSYTDRSVYKGIEKYQAALIEQDRVKTASSYRSLTWSLQKFKPKGDLEYAEVTPTFLRSYEKWMDNEGKSKTTVGIYLRALRTIFNVAKEKGYIVEKQYPFGRRRYSIPTGMNTKKSLTKDEIRMIISYEPAPDTFEAICRDYWLFSYFSNGINIKDMAKLKYKDINSKTITFKRSKTEYSTRGNAKPIYIALLPQAEEIINRWGNPYEGPNQYVFPIAEPGMSALELERRVEQTIQNMNKNMKRIGKKLGITTPITTYVARHTFATILKRGGAPVAYISDSLGHTNLRTTENYLASFDEDARSEFAKLLL